MAKGFAVLVVAALLPISDKATDRTTQDDPKLQGTWAVTALEDSRGRGKITEDSDEYSTWEIKEGKIARKRKKKREEMSYAADPSHSPKAIDLTGFTDDDKVRRAIYEINGEELTICINMRGGKRPSVLSAKNEDDYLLVVLRRLKK
jgi:uncharacterized protein (TIGR03067 family)